MKTLEDFLKDKHAEEYMGTDDNMPDAFDDWMGNLDVQEVMDYATEWMNEFRADILKSVDEIAKILA